MFSHGVKSKPAEPLNIRAVLLGASSDWKRFGWSKLRAEPTLKVKGKPSKGKEATNEVKITVSKKWGLDDELW
jgi:hypothetical protein